MKVKFAKKFQKNLGKTRNKNLREAIITAISQTRKGKDISEIPQVKKLTGHKIFYRIRLGDYRIGLKIEKGIVSFMDFAHRKDIYKKFP